ncbi:MAG TPA: MBL fold metallo-hydrolase [Caulobacteraceae bacterium]
MRDGVADCDRPAPDEDIGEPARRAVLTYPCAAPPQPGDAVEVADGVLWLRLPLPFSLDHINVWALRDGDGWTLVDSGLATPASEDGWLKAFAGPLGGRPVRRMIVTHMHPDHVGTAGWICDRFDAPLLMTRLEYLTCRSLVADTGRPAPEQGVRFLRAAGWDEAQLQDYRDRFGMFGRGVRDFPDGFERMTDGDVLNIDGRGWRVVGGNGHCPEHACLLREDDQVFISGDQVLPKISSNVSVWPTEPKADPLSDWIASLAKLKREVPADALVLPSHGEPFLGLHGRLDALARGHEASLKRLRRRLREPKRAVDVFSTLFARPVGRGDFGMATGESLAHLHCLLTRGEAVKETDADGVDWWRAIEAEEAA